MDSNNNIDFRSEQQQAIAQTVRYFKRKHNMLWNAKMRFGKTLCALEVARQCGYRRTLISVSYTHLTLPTICSV